MDSSSPILGAWYAPGFWEEKTVQRGPSGPWMLFKNQDVLKSTDAKLSTSRDGEIANRLLSTMSNTTAAWEVTHAQTSRW